MEELPDGSPRGYYVTVDTWSGQSSFDTLDLATTGTQRGEVCPHLGDVVQTRVSTAGEAGSFPTGREVTIRRPDGVLLLVVDYDQVGLR